MNKDPKYQKQGRVLVWVLFLLATMFFCYMVVFEGPNIPW